MVYPHYFSGAKLRFAFAEATASKQPFDPRWTLFFTPHSAALEPSLVAKACGAWWWNEAPSRFDMANFRNGVKKGRDAIKRVLLREQLDRVNDIATRHRAAPGGGANELHRIAQWLFEQWTPEKIALLNSP